MVAGEQTCPTSSIDDARTIHRRRPTIDAKRTYRRRSRGHFARRVAARSHRLGLSDIECKRPPSRHFYRFTLHDDDHIAEPEHDRLDDSYQQRIATKRCSEAPGTGGQLIQHDIRAKVHIHLYFHVIDDVHDRCFELPPPNNGEPGSGDAVELFSKNDPSGDVVRPGETRTPVSRKDDARDDARRSGERRRDLGQHD